MTVDIVRGVFHSADGKIAALPTIPDFDAWPRPRGGAAAPRSPPIIALLLAPRPVFVSLCLAADFEKIG
jgi:hypothetical protein